MILHKKYTYLRGELYMKEKIYTIPVNEAYDTDTECPLCFLEKRLETEAVDYALGAAMMEPDYRTQSNAIGYCGKHFAQMFARPNKLALALVLDTHLEEIRSKLKKHGKSMASSGKSKLFSKGVSSGADVTAQLDKIAEGCMVCQKINSTMERYIDVLLYMWSTDAEFKRKFDNSKGVCLKHMNMLIKSVPKSLNSKNGAEFLASLYAKELDELERIQNDIHKFTLKFDYRNANMEWGSAKDAPIRTIEKISGEKILENFE